MKASAAHLQVVLGVPVRVEDDAGVGGRQVDAQPPRPRAQQEHEAVRVGLAEAVDGRLPQVPAHAPVDTLVQVSGGEDGDANGQHVKGPLYASSQTRRKPVSVGFFSARLAGGGKVTLREVTEKPSRPRPPPQ